MKAELVTFVEKTGGGFLMHIEADGRRHTFEMSIDGLRLMIEHGVQAMAWVAARHKPGSSVSQPETTPPAAHPSRA